MPPSKPPYRPEFKTEAVSFYHQSGKNLQEIASDLGVSTNSLREWVRRTNGENASKGKSRMGLSQDEREELLRGCLKRLLSRASPLLLAIQSCVWACSV